MIYKYKELDKCINIDTNKLIYRLTKDKKNIIMRIKIEEILFQFFSYKKNKIKDILSQFFGYKNFNDLKKFKKKGEIDILYLSKKELIKLKKDYNKYIEENIHNGNYKHGYSSHYTFLEDVVPICKKEYNFNSKEIFKLDLNDYKYIINLNEEQFMKYCFLFCDIKSKYPYEEGSYDITKYQFEIIFKYLNLLKISISKENLYKYIKPELIKNNINNVDKNISSISKEICKYLRMDKNNEEIHFEMTRISYILRHPYFFGNDYLDIKPEIIELSNLKDKRLSIYFHDYDINTEILNELILD